MRGERLCGSLLEPTQSENETDEKAKVASCGVCLVNAPKGYLQVAVIVHVLAVLENWTNVIFVGGKFQKK